MKTPKLLAAVPILALSASAVVGWSAITRASQADVSGAKEIKPDPPSEQPGDSVEADRIAKMDNEINLIAARLWMSAPMQKASPAMEKMFERNLADGTLINVTLDEVEAAVKAAATTPETDDDVAAERLKHCGTYRFFAPE